MEAACYVIVSIAALYYREVSFRLLQGKDDA